MKIKGVPNQAPNRYRKPQEGFRKSYSTKKRRVKTLRTMYNQVVRIEDRPYDCIVKLKENKYGVRWHVASLTERVFDDEQKCYVVRQYGKRFKVTKSDLAGVWDTKSRVETTEDTTDPTKVIDIKM